MRKLSKLFDTFYSKLAPKTGILICPITKQRLQLIKRKYRNLEHPTWKVSSLPKPSKRKSKKILKVNSIYFPACMPTATAAEHIVTYARAFLTAYAYLPVIYFVFDLRIYMCL